MEYLNRKFIIDIAIKGLMLFLGLIIFLFLILGEKTNNEDFVYRLYDNAQDIYFISTFFFAYAEMLVLLYIRDKKINDKATHYISIIYSFIVSFILYLNIDSDDERYLGFSNFIFLFITIEITSLVSR